MSGTSVDSIDATLVSCTTEHCQLIHHHSHPLSSSFRHTVLHYMQGKQTVTLPELLQLDQDCAEQFSAAVHALLAKTPYHPEAIRAIGSHGQTLYHRPPQKQQTGQTWQIGNPAWIAAATGITTIADFRRADMALGGQGAPLAPAYHHAMLRSDKENRLILNIGGIANLTVLPADRTEAVIGFDTGVGNGLMNAWIKQQQGHDYDHAGQWAVSGQINHALLEALLNDAYFQQTPPKSTGREYFNLNWLLPYLHGRDISPVDIQATLTALTVHSIAQAVKPYQAQRLLICGGGVHNPLLCQGLSERLPYPVESTAAYGIDPDWVEACCFAWLAYRRLEGLTGNVPSVTGATKACLLGGIYA